MLENRLQFNAQQARLRFDAYDLALPLRRHEKALQTMLQRTLPLTVLQYRCDQRDRLLTQQVRQVLGNTVHMLRTAAAAQSLAATLNLSLRFLHRQLQEESVFSQSLKGGAHSEKARDLLPQATKLLTQMAAARFRNEKSFSPAFQGWTGTAGVFRTGKESQSFGTLKHQPPDS